MVHDFNNCSDICSRLQNCHEKQQASNLLKARRAEKRNNTKAKFPASYK